MRHSGLQVKNKQTKGWAWLRGKIHVYVWSLASSITLFAFALFCLLFFSPRHRRVSSQRLTQRQQGEYENPSERTGSVHPNSAFLYYLPITHEPERKGSWLTHEWNHTSYQMTIPTPRFCPPYWKDKHALRMARISPFPFFWDPD